MLIIWRKKKKNHKNPTVCCRQLKSLGQKLGAAVAVVHISRREDSLPQPSPRQDKGGKGDTAGKGEWTLRVANVGDTEVVLCHHGRVVPLTRQFDVMVDAEECQRVIKSGGIVTEVRLTEVSPEASPHYRTVSGDSV